MTDAKESKRKEGDKRNKYQINGETKKAM